MASHDEVDRPLDAGEIADRLAIHDLLVRYCRAIDTLDWRLLDRVFTPDATIDYTSSGGIAGAYAEVRAWLEQVLPGFPMRQHLIANEEVEIDGDRATSRAYLFNPMARADAGGGSKLFFVGGAYVDELVRTPQGWRIRRRVEQQSWVDVRP
ncbi:nuclear transport factor 2 family protein [bacterium]|nr:nuclear transport factor 2 family protein [bacterium]